MDFSFISSSPAIRRVFFFTAIFAALAPCVTFAGDATDIGEIEVKGEAPPLREPRLDKTAAATVIVPEESKELANTIPQIVEQSAGVHIRRFGGLDDFSAISLRGSSAAQVQVYLDDIPLATSQGEPTDLSIIPLETIKSVEVYRGGSPGMLADSTAGGVIIMRSKDRPEKTATSVRAMGGSFSTFKGTVSRAENFGGFSYAAAFERSQSAGDFPFLNNAGTTFNIADDRMEIRQNNDFGSNTLFTKFMIDAPKNFDVSIFNTFFNKSQGIAGLGNFQSQSAHLRTWRDLAAASLDKKFESIEGLAIHADVFFDFLKDEFRDPYGEVGLGVQNNDDDTFRFGENFRTQYILGSHQELKSFVAHRAEFFLPMSRAGAAVHGQQSRRNTISTGIEDEIFLFRDRLSLVPSARFSALFNDLSSEDPSVASASNGANTRRDYQISAKVGLKARMINEFYFRGNFYRGFRNPTFSELFGDRGTIVGNPGLNPEKSLNFDAGLAYHYIGGSDREVSFDIEALYFRNSVTNLIQFIQTSQFAIRAQNMNKALIQGVEVSARVALRERLSGFASYTFQDPKDAGSQPATKGKYLPGRPRHELAAGLTWREDLAANFGTKLYGDVHYMSGNYLDTQNLLSVGSRTLVSAGAGVILAKAVTLSFTVKNIANERISDIVGYPLPGRSYWIAAELNI